MAAVVVDLEKNHAVKIDGILGSNSLRFFQVTLDYQNHEITLFNTTQPVSVESDNSLQIPFDTDFRDGFAPKLTCLINGNIQCLAIIDTGYPDIASVPLPLMKEMKSFVDGKAVTSQGSMVAGIGGNANESYALRLHTLQLSSLLLENIPSISHSSENGHVLLGNRFLSKFLVIIDYPSHQVFLQPRDTAFETNIFTYGLKLKKEDQKTIVSGTWDGSHAARSGLKSGDEITTVNGTDASVLSLFELMSLLGDQKIDPTLPFFLWRFLSMIHGSFGKHCITA